MFSVSTLILGHVTMKGVMSHMKVVFFMHRDIESRLWKGHWGYDSSGSGKVEAIEKAICNTLDVIFLPYDLWKPESLKVNERMSRVLWSCVLIPYENIKNLNYVNNAWKGAIFCSLAIQEVVPVSLNAALTSFPVCRFKCWSCLAFCLEDGSGCTKM